MLNAKRLVIGLVVLVAVVAGGLFWRAERTHWRWDKIAMPERVARVPVEWPLPTLAARLQKTGKVRDASAFLEAAKTVGLRHVAAGGYKLPPEASPLDLARIFNTTPDFIKITFPEGWTAEQMARRLEADRVPAAGAFRRLAYPPGQTVSPLEGTLFPATYEMPVRAAAPAIVALLRRHFQSAVGRLPKQLPAGASGVALTVPQVVTLASLVEGETSVPEERSLIAGVLLNRLRRNMRLQCDATVQYVRERAAAEGLLAKGHKNRLLYSDLKLDSPYNTYLHKGLPPGPINNPGEATLQAAAAPQATPYLFYVMSSHQGRHFFARTFAEHEHNIALARAGR